MCEWLGVSVGLSDGVIERVPDLTAEGVTAAQRESVGYTVRPGVAVRMPGV